MLMFSRSSTSNGVSTRDQSKSTSASSSSATRNGRNSYYEAPQSLKTSSSSVAKSVTKTDAKNVAKSDTKNGDESPTLMKRTSNRSTMKKSRPHSWHSTLQRGFQRARSRSSGRGEKNRDLVAAANSQKQNGRVTFYPIILGLGLKPM